MSIRRQLILLTALVFFALLLVGGIGFAGMQHLQDNRLENQTTSTILYLLFEKRLATDSYVINQNSTTKQEWLRRQTDVEKLIADTKSSYDTPSQIRLMASMAASLQKSRALFQSLTALYEQKKDGEAAKVIEVQMIAVTTQTIQAAFNLQTDVRLEEDAAFTDLLLVSTSATVLFFVLLLTSFLIIWRRTIDIENKTQELYMILNNLPIGVCLVRFPDGKPLLANATATKILGRSIDAAVTKNDYCALYSVVEEDGSPYPSEKFPLTVTLNTGKPDLKKEIFINKPSGEKIALQVGAAPITDTKGKTVEALAVFSDITKEREIDKMKNEFIALASHQMRTPLSAAKWLLEMLTKGDAGKLSTKQAELVSQINESNEHMIELINALLNVSRIESGRIIIEPEKLNIASLVKEITRDVKKLFDEKKQTLSVEVAKDIPEIAVDKKLVRQVYVNLLTNANKYTKEGGSIKIVLSKKDNELLSQVVDTGYGIPKEEKEKVFRKFYRGSNIQKIEPTGTGLGLYLAKAIVESSGGKIWFDSQENEGTTFSFTLPLSGMKAQKGEVSID